RYESSDDIAEAVRPIVVERQAQLWIEETREPIVKRGKCLRPESRGRARPKQRRLRDRGGRSHRSDPRHRSPLRADRWQQCRRGIDREAWQLPAYFFDHRFVLFEQRFEHWSLFELDVNVAWKPEHGAH